MKLILKQSEFVHIKEQSSYNNNYYKHKIEGYVIHEKCHEDHYFYEFDLLGSGEPVFLGCSQDGFNNDEFVNIDFKIFYT